MCILFIYTNPSPQKGGYRLVVASNRDEYYKRPARGVFHCEKTGIIGGRDMEPGREGGMWLGVALKKQPPKLIFSALLNVTGAKKCDGALGRGPIVYNYLTSSDGSTRPFVETLRPPQIYTGFNVVTVELTEDSVTTFHHGNCPDSTLEFPGEQVLGFGNSNPAAPLTKVEVGKERFGEIVRTTMNRDELIEKLLGLLKCTERHLPDAELEKRDPRFYEGLSQIFVQIGDAYGTRTHSLILVDYEGNVEFIEHTMKEPIDTANPEWEVRVMTSHL